MSSISEIKKKALEKIRKNKSYDYIKEVPDLYGKENGEYYELKWDYPGQYYKQGLRIDNDEECINYIANKTVKDSKK